ncbi:diguanylate cyclase [Pseudoalteromonas sp. SSDWG2]|uniref:sensor domain-containing diguanylate cyclase n=1 Tax=Pseudoalteromonas sp. SSDWG2 TaxID=3139391 RepID=UPI003BA8E4FF
MLNKYSLISRLALVLVLTSFIAGVIAVKYYFESTYRQEVDKAQLAVEQLHKTVSNTASIAAYLKDKDLALEVVTGLLKNDIILGVKIKSDEVELASGGVLTGTNQIIYQLFNPFFDNEVVGSIALIPAQQHIELSAQKIAQASAQLLVMQTFVVLVIFIILAYFIVTKPMGILTEDLKKIVPGSSNRLNTPYAQKESEIGQMTNSINKMLEAAQAHFSQERELRSEVQELGSRLQLLFEHAAAAMILANRDGKVMLFNASTSEILNRINVTISENLFDLVDRAFMDAKQVKKHIADNLDKNDVARGEYQLLNDRAGNPVWVHILVTRSYGSDNVAYLQIFINDITSHKTMLEHLSYEAHTDQLTGLLNRVGAERRLSKRLSTGQNLALMLIDLDGFKPINDVFGHEAGDVILCYVANQLVKNLRKEDICCRWGGDEFVVVVETDDVDDAMRLAEKLRDAVSTPTQLENGETVSVGASIGVALAPTHGTEIKDLVSAADKAMYSVKREHKNATALAPH